MVVIDLTEQEAELFKKFRKFQNLFEQLDNMQSGKVTVHIANNQVRFWEVSASYPQKDKIVQTNELIRALIEHSTALVCSSTL